MSLVFRVAGTKRCTEYKFLTWNIVELKAKLTTYNIPDFLCDFDIDLFRIQESWDVDPNYCDNFFKNNVRFDCKARSSSSEGRPMGRVHVFVHKRLSSKVSQR